MAKEGFLEEEVSSEDLPGERDYLLLMKMMGLGMWSGTFPACPGLSTQHRVNLGMAIIPAAERV